MGELSSKCEEFLTVRRNSTALMASIFLRLYVDNPRPLCEGFLRFIVRFFLRQIIINNAALHFMPRMNAVFTLDVATALRQINR